MKREYTVIIEQDEAGFYVADVPELYGCHTQAKSLDELMARVREAIEVCREEQKDNRPGKQLIGIQRIAV
jgi:predicted RNase H-like HicB family nuclease